jgi:hypothetical protein
MTIDFNSFQNNKTIAGQTSQSFTTGIKNLSSAVSTGVSGALNAVSSKLGLSGLSSGGSVSGASGTLGSTNIIAELKDKIGVAGEIGAVLPESVPNKSQPPAAMIYPKDLGKYYIQFFFFDNFQDSPIKRLTKRNTFMLSLPVPDNLQEQFNMAYSDQQLGMLGILEATGMLTPQSIETIVNGNMDQVGDVASVGATRTKNLLTAGGGGSASLAVARYTSRALGLESVGTALDRVTGTIINPYQQLQFEGVGLREHTFSYTFSPNSEAEANDLKKIVRELKVRMHPTLNGLLMNFPDQCKIKLSSGLGDYYTFQDCYLKSMSVNYAPSGTPAFFKQGAHPVEIKVDLTFGEIRPITRNTYTGETDGVSSIAEATNPTSPWGTSEASTPIPEILRSK